MKKSPKRITAAVLLCSGLAYWMLHAFALTISPSNRAVGYVGMPTPTRHDISSGNESVFVIDYSASNWSGNLHKLAISTTGEISTTDEWTGGAAAQVGTQGWDARKIVTFNGSNKISFRWSSLSSTQKSALGNNEEVLKYLRGNRSNEGAGIGQYRVRGSVLGDFVHTTPVYWEDMAQQNSSGTLVPSTQCGGSPCKTVFVSGNDGMLHAFDAGTGAERFAFIPQQLFSELIELSNQNYTHRYFVDGQLAIRKYSNQVLLTGSLGRGGKGLYGLDVSNPNPSTEATAANNLLWEISSNTTGFANLGYVDGRLVLSEYQNGANKVPALITGNGYGNTGNYQASLLVINAQTGAKLSEISTGSGSSGSPNGLSAPTLVDTNLDGVADLAYAGDMLGVVWKFDLNAHTASKLHTLSPARPITMAPAITRHPKNGLMVVFVTGKLFNDDDKADTSTNYVYGIWDGAPSSNTSLLTQTLTETNYTGTRTVRVRTVSNNAINWTSHKGWMIALPKSGERLIGGDNALISQNSFRFMSYNPTTNTSENPPGENWWMELDPITGSSTRQVRFDLNQDGLLSNADLVNNNMPVGRYMGGGVRSQLLSLYNGSYAYFVANYDKNSETTTAQPPLIGRGVSGGHFDVEFYKDPSEVCRDYTTTTYDPSTAGYHFYDSTAPSESTNKTVCYVWWRDNGSNDRTADYSNHKHEYDDAYDKTGVNFLNASKPALNLANAVALQANPNKSFKVLIMNQYLSPAAMLHIGRTDYDPSSITGYVPIRTYQTGSGLSVTSLPSYTLSTIGSLVINLPTDAFGVTDWWGNGQERNGLHSSSPACVFSGNAVSGIVDTYGRDLSTDTGAINSPIPSSLADMYTPVVPPISGGGPGTLATESSKAQGARHNGALTIQIVDANITDSDIEQNVAGRPQYGYRVKQSRFFSKVIAEYTIFWHHPREVCYQDSNTPWYNGNTGGNKFYSSSRGAWNTTAAMTGTGWTSTAPADIRTGAASETPASGSSDPKIGSFSSSGFGGTSGGSGTSGTGGSGTGTGTSSSSNSKSNIVVGGEVLNVNGNVSTSSVNTGNCGSECSKVGGYAPPVGRINWRELFK